MIRYRYAFISVNNRGSCLFPNAKIVKKNLTQEEKDLFFAKESEIILWMATGACLFHCFSLSLHQLGCGFLEIHCSVAAIINIMYKK